MRPNSRWGPMVKTSRILNRQRFFAPQRQTEQHKQLMRCYSCGEELFPAFSLACMHKVCQRCAKKKASGKMRCPQCQLKSQPLFDPLMTTLVERERCQTCLQCQELCLLPTSHLCDNMRRTIIGEVIAMHNAPDSICEAAMAQLNSTCPAYDDVDAMSNVVVSLLQKSESKSRHAIKARSQDGRCVVRKS